MLNWLLSTNVLGGAGAIVGDPPEIGELTWISEAETCEARDCIFLIPTHAMQNTSTILAQLSRVIHATEHLQKSAGLQVQVVVIIQYGMDSQTLKLKAYDIARRVNDLNARKGISVWVAIFDATTKVDSINQVWKLASSCSAKAIGWCDDDVRFESHTLSSMWSALFANTWVVGCAKRGNTTGNTFTAKLLIERRARNGKPRYPHGCMILASTTAPAFPIPRRVSDDGWIAASLLESRTEMENVFAGCSVIDSVVEYDVQETMKNQFIRVVRIYIDSFQILALLPELKRIHFLKYALFPRLFDAPIFKDSLSRYGLWEFRGVGHLICFGIWLGVGTVLQCKRALGLTVERPDWSVLVRIKRRSSSPATKSVQ
jgi:hypothetical protein